MIIHKEQVPYRFPDGRNGWKLITSYINKEGKVAFLQYPIPQDQMFEWKYATRGNADPPFYEYDYQKNEYVLDEKGEKIQHQWMSYDNKPVTRVATDKQLSGSRITELLQSFKSAVDPVFEMNKPETWFCDIEVDVIPDQGFPEATEAPTPVNTISMTNYPRTIIWSRKPLSQQDIDWVQDQIAQYSENNTTDNRFKECTKGYKFEFRSFNTEKEMLQDFVNFIVPVAHITGWNFLAFDWLYLWNRFIKNQIDTSVLSPTRHTVNFKINPRAGGASINVTKPMHKIISDYLLIVKTWEQSLGNLPDYKLDTVGEKALTMKKVVHPWGFDVFYKDHFKEYVFYNCIDTILLEQINNEIKTMDVWLMLSSILRVDLDSAFSTIAPAETVMQVFEYDRFKIFPNVKHVIPDEQSEYTGAWVVPVSPGLYRQVGGLDFASLYPSIMRQFLISPETFKYKKDPKTYKAAPDEIMTCSGAVYERNEQSMIPSILTYYYNLRKQTKVDKKTCEDECEMLEKEIKKRTSAAKSAL